MFFVERDYDSNLYTSLNLEDTPPMGMQSLCSVSERLSTGAPVLRSHGRSPSCICSGGQGGEKVSFSKILHQHQGCLTLEEELQTFLTEHNIGPVPLLKETSHKLKVPGLKACSLVSFVPKGVPLMCCPHPSLRSSYP